MLVQALVSVLGIAAAAAPFANAQVKQPLIPTGQNAIQPLTLDICSLLADTGTCDARIPRLAFDRNIGKCRLFFFGGCGGNANNFETVKECEAACAPTPTDICRLPKVVGPCKEALKRYAYNPKSASCKLFAFGGCRGNANNFKTLKECEKACRAPPPPPPPVEDICNLPTVIGPCRSRLRRYAYSSKSGNCKPFPFGGCRGNANNFKTLKECEKACRFRG